MIAGHDRQRAPLLAKFGQSPQALRVEQVVSAAPRSPSRNRRDHRRSPADRRGSIGSASRGSGGRDRVGRFAGELAGEVVRHGRNVLAVRSWSGSEIPAQETGSAACTAAFEPADFLTRGVAGAPATRSRARPGRGRRDPEIGKGRALPRGVDLAAARPRGSRRGPPGCASSG